ncbi:HD domain-containing protein [Aspergillus keveii]|uniref:5'-deoxynucleotidase n=1 Tax=Aspergillus keveii TaxID=714993 RepID=A0ABR4FKP1_9EURO
MDNTPLSFLHAIGRLKDVPRTGWLRTISNPESVSDHSFRVAVLSYLAPPSMNLDMAKCIKMALFHDLGEAVIGDIPTFAGVPKDVKYKMEQNGFEFLTTLLQEHSPEKAAEISSLWEEYEEGKSAESRWVKQMDKFECLIQAHEYEERTFGEKDLSEFQGQSEKIESPVAVSWLRALQEERNGHLNRRAKRLPIVFLTGNIFAGVTSIEEALRSLGLAFISMEKALSSRADDPNDPWSGFIQRCRGADFDIPVGLRVQILEEEIGKLPTASTLIPILGFPTSVEQNQEFQRKVQKSNATIWINSGDVPQQLVEDNHGNQRWKPVVDLKRYLQSSASYFSEWEGSDGDLGKKLKDFMDDFQAPH